MQFTLLSVAALAASVSGLGINCRGSGLCPSDGASGNVRRLPLLALDYANTRHQLINLKSIVDNISDRNRRYNTGQQIACTGSLCAFYQNGATGTANDASAQLQQLLDHGCKKCGSVPTQPGNDVSQGELTAKCVSPLLFPFTFRDL